MKPRTPDARDAAASIVRTLRDAGHAAYFAGGCVRDRLLGRAPQDYDVVTDARPERVRELFHASRAVGQQFGVVLVRKRGVDVEVATFRADAAYSDGRRPDQVTFCGEIEDARRRDFTINGMFEDPVTDRIIDHVGGQADLAAGVVRTIGDPEARFAEDHLRMLRAVRFAVALGFRIEPLTFEAIRTHAAKLTRISPERIWMELDRMLTATGRATAWRLLRDTGLVDHLAPGWRFEPEEAERIERRLAALPTGRISAPLSVAAILLDRGPRDTRTFCRDLRLSNDQTEGATWLVQESLRFTRSDADEFAQLRFWRAHTLGNDLPLLAHADVVARGENPERWQKVAAAFNAIDPVQATPPPLLSGDDLTRAGYAPGPVFGRVLAAVYRAQLNERVRTSEEAATLADQLMRTERAS
ncbi:MAG: CCA tRNA nucleotidyltransferase [Phycisphaerae bacterium]|nr:CCA tRNA nucleotidyltransferase [Planctomycetia bacterium]MCK6465948.1 CCA tRNA nucleotidyltransferase [Phycisphaerae bacterium]MCL4719685.1 CCA tRNA nucleotidyltransferase [Phycisphaerae bacterium]NUQ09561.1 CCA tRNA nucleotidyltransferase [Phycisphaerae bacterium]